MGKVTEIDRAEATAKKRVAAYARVSTDSESMNHSLATQVSYYSTKIRQNPEWEYAGVFADFGISGTGTSKRNEFKRMLEAAENGEIDIILTKSIQRFARNTVDLLKTVRHLKDIGVEVRFEKENINSLSGDGELLLTILAAFAQEESRSISENIRWSKAKTAAQGIMTNASAPYGYRCENKKLYIVPEKAEIVKKMFYDYTENRMSVCAIAKKLNADGIPSPRNSLWTQTLITHILQNVNYTGNMLLGKTYVDSYLSHKRVFNKGERQSYFVKDTHEAIIPQEFFDKTQKILNERAAARRVHCFKDKIICGCCGGFFKTSNYKTKAYGRRYVWLCVKKPRKCPTAILNERELEDIIAEKLGADSFTESLFENEVEKIYVGENDVLQIIKKDGTVIDVPYTRMGKRAREK